MTNRPAIANSWYEDFVKFIGTESGFRFVSEVSALKGKPFVMSREEYTESLTQELADCIEFVSLQNLKGSLYFGGQHDKLKELVNMQWELLVIDEAHEGVDTSKTDVAFHQIKCNHTLHLSGTPFKALAMDEGVNYTAGLPVIRTSPAHGTAYDIAGKGLASEDSFRQAIYVAIDVFRNRLRDKEAHANPLRKQYYEKRDDSDKLKLDSVEEDL